MTDRTIALLLLTALAAGPAAGEEPGAARLEATLVVAPVELPPKSGGRHEVAYAFGKKDGPAEMAQVLARSLGDRLTFEKVAASGPADFTLEIRLDQARSEHEDFGGWESRDSTYEVTATVHHAWRNDSGEVVHAGEVLGFGRVSLSGTPRRPEARIAWERLLDDAASRAFSAAYEAAAFGNDPPPAGGWIASTEKGKSESR